MFCGRCDQAKRRKKMKFAILSLMFTSASIASAQEEFLSVDCRSGGFFSTRNQIFFAAEGSEVDSSTTGFTVKGSRVRASKAISQDPSCSYDYYFLRFEDLEPQPIDPPSPRPQPEPVPVPVPPCLYPGQYPYCLPMGSLKTMKIESADSSSTPFYEIRDFNALSFGTDSVPAVYSCAAGSSVTYISKQELAVEVSNLYVAPHLISGSGRVVAKSERHVTAPQCLTFKNLN